MVTGKKKYLNFALALCMFLGSLFAFSGCNFADVDQSTYVVGVFTQEDYLGVKGTKIRKGYGDGEEVVLRGTNAGGYLIIEQWMTAVEKSIDHKNVTELFNARFGEEKTAELWAYYRNQFWTEQDFQNCADMGMTVLRLPFSYMNVDINGEYDFSQLDYFVEGAAKYGIYTILDMHGAYGSQNGRDHSGEKILNPEGLPADEAVDFYRNEEKKRKTLELWRAIALHYRNNPAIAAFDLLNEPGELGASTSEPHWNFYDRLYGAIREIDNNRVVIFESCWTAEDFPHPSVYGWNNCIYSYHFYPWDNEVGAEGPISFLQQRLGDVEALNLSVPVYLGEFSCFNEQEVWEWLLRYLNEKGWHWTNWSYKVNGSVNGWGIFKTNAPSVDANIDELETIYKKWADIGTAAQSAQRTAFASGTTLYDILKEACSA